MIDVGTGRQLFVDRHLIEREESVELVLHQPVRREVVWQRREPWEGDICWSPTVLYDEGRYRMWYWSRSLDERGQFRWNHTAYLESDNGIDWQRPRLGLIDFEGSTANNLMFPPRGLSGRNVTVFRDTSPAAPPSARYKALMADPRASVGLYALESPDGIDWRLVDAAPVIPSPPKDPQFDSPIAAFWDPWRHEYALYCRGWYLGGDQDPGAATPQPPRNGAAAGAPAGDDRTDTVYKPPLNRRRRVRRTSSSDFRSWTPFTVLEMDFHSEPREQFYTSSTIPYLAAPNHYFMFPMRLFEERTFDPHWIQPGLSDVAFLSSRDGIRWDRTFRDAWVRPGLDALNWHERAIMVGHGLVPTRPHELSLYICEHFRTPEVRFVRATVRPDGFTSVHASLGGGEFVTPALTHAGDRLEINYSTSALGCVRVEIQDEAGNALDGFALSDCDPVYGDELHRAITWRGASDLPRGTRSAMRLRFQLCDADVYALQFSAHHHGE